MASTCGYDSTGAPRVAEPGYDCTVFQPAGIWGFCPTTVVAASDCGLAIYCYDKGSCSTGCGAISTGPDYLTVITCTSSDACSIVVSDNGGGQLFQYIACGATGTAQTLYPTPPPVAASVTSVPVTVTSLVVSTASSASAISTSISTSTSTSISTSNTLQTSSASSSPTSSIGYTTPVASSSTTLASTTNQQASAVQHRSTTPIGPIIGGVLGGVAIICLTILIIVLIRRKNASSRNVPSNLPYGAVQSQQPYQDHPSSMSHADSRYDSYFQKGQEGDRALGPFEAQAVRDPAELPASPR